MSVTERGPIRHTPEAGGSQRHEDASARDGAPQNRRAGAPGHALGRRPRDARRPPVHSAPVAAQECRHGSECREAHADFGTSGRAQTVAALDRAGIAHTGFPSEITCLRANGIRVAFLGFAPYAFDANPLDYAGALALVRWGADAVLPRREPPDGDQGTARAFGMARISSFSPARQALRVSHVSPNEFAYRHQKTRRSSASFRLASTGSENASE